MGLLASYTNSIFQDIESYLRTEVQLVEEEIRLVLDEYISFFSNISNHLRITIALLHF